MRLGRVEIQRVSDGIMHLDGGTLFGVLPRTAWSRFFPADEANRIPVATNSYLITSEGRRILVDTGLGTRLSPREIMLWGLERDGHVIENLAQMGVTPEQIDVVILTHLHPDHAAGNTLLVDGKLAPAFPKAQHWVQKREWEAATRPNEWSRMQYDPQNFMPIAEAGLLHLVDGDTAVTSEVRCVLAEGHTPGHQCAVVESDGRHAVVMGDVAPMAPHLERVHLLASFDMEPMANLQTKKRLFQEAHRDGTVFLLAHDPNAWACRLEEQEGRRRAVPCS